MSAKRFKMVDRRLAVGKSLVSELPVVGAREMPDSVIPQFHKRLTAAAGNCDGALGRHGRGNQVAHADQDALMMLVGDAIEIALARARFEHGGFCRPGQNSINQLRQGSRPTRSATVPVHDQFTAGFGPNGSREAIIFQQTLDRPRKRRGVVGQKDVFVVDQVQSFSTDAGANRRRAAHQRADHHFCLVPAP